MKIDGTVEVIRNKNPVLNMFAVIGPATGYGGEHPEALLMEIGLWRTRPYREATYRENGRRKWLRERAIWFKMSPEQYQLVAPRLFEELGEYAKSIMRSWKRGPYSDNPIKIFVPKTHYGIAKRKFEMRERYRPALQGVRFSISVEDEFLLSDVYWAELNEKGFRGQQLRGLARYVDMVLSRLYKGNQYSGERFLRLQGVQNLIDSCSRLRSHPYLLKELVRSKRIKDDRFFLILKSLGVEDDATSRERQYADEVLPHPQKRISMEELQIRMMSGLQKAKPYVVAEILPPPLPFS